MEIKEDFLDMSCDSDAICIIGTLLAVAFIPAQPDQGLVSSDDDPV